MAVALPGFNRLNVKAPAGAGLKHRFSCIVCFGRVQKPVKTCTIGHIICKECCRQLPDCPLCHKDFSDNQNLELSNILESSIFPCENSLVGCRISLIYAEIMEHEKKTCNYKRVECCLNSDTTNASCNKSTLLHEYKSHVETHHKQREKISSDEEVEKDLTIKLGENFKSVELMEVYYKDSEKSVFFIENMFYSAQHQMLCISYHLLGRVEQTKNYTYEVKMVDKKNPNTYIIHKNHCLPVGLTDGDITTSGRALVFCTSSFMSSIERSKVLRYFVKFDNVFNEKKKLKKELQKKLEDTKRGLPEKILNTKFESKNEESEIFLDEQKNCAVKKVAEDQKEVKKDYEESFVPFAKKIIETAFAPYIFFIIYVFILFVFGK